MVTRFAIELDLPSKDHAHILMQGMRAIAEANGWKIVSMGPVTGDPPCPQCGSPMTYDATLQTYVCHHPG